MERVLGICKLLFLALVRLYVATLAHVMCTEINNKPSKPSARCVPYSMKTHGWKVAWPRQLLQQCCDLQVLEAARSSGGRAMVTYRYDILMEY